MAGVADWLASRRTDLNRRFERMRQRFPALSPDAALAMVADILPPLAGPEPSADELLSSTYDLVLLHVARGSLGSRPGIHALLRRGFPQLRHLLVQRPSSLPAALSNAVENMAHRGDALVEVLCEVASAVERSDILVDAVAVASWRLGEARLRDAALEIAPRLPANVLLRVLDLADWPPAAAPQVIASLRANGWLHPRALFSEATLRALRDGTVDVDLDVIAAAQNTTGAARAALRTWNVVSKIGGFSGFDGSFDAPPLVLDGGGPHHVFARCGVRDFRIDADVFGWVCRPHPTVDLPVRMTAAPSALRRFVARLSAAPNANALAIDGTLTVAGDSVQIPALAGAVSYTIGESFIATSCADSYRIAIAGPVAEAHAR